MSQSTQGGMAIPWRGLFSSRAFLVVEIIIGDVSTTASYIEADRRITYV